MTAVVLNATVTQPAAGSYLTVWPAGAVRPLAFGLNFAAGETRPNLLVVKLGAVGKVSVFSPAGPTSCRRGRPVPVGGDPPFGCVVAEQRC